MPLCKKAPGAVGWLDFGCGNLANHITNPCNDEIPIPAWLQTNPGNPNNLEDELGRTDRAQPGRARGGGQPSSASRSTTSSATTRRATTSRSRTAPSYPNWGGDGSGTFYHVPIWVGFKLDGAYSGGSDPECNQLPGSPLAGGNGATGCLKGWFVAIYRRRARSHRSSIRAPIGHRDCAGRVIRRRSFRGAGASVGSYPTRSGGIGS